MKTCEYSGCTNQINVWKKFCENHERMMMQQAQQQRQMVAETPPVIPQSRVSMPTEDNQPQKIMPKPVFEPRILEGKERPLKVDAMRFAIDLIRETDIEQKPYDQLLGELRTMTNDIEKILLEK